jgi:hypothetical protein
MKMRPGLWLAIACSAVSVAQAGNARPLRPSSTWAGTWQLDPGQSRFAGPAPRAETRTISFIGNRMSVVSTGVGPSGAPMRFSYSVRLDGRFHPLVGNPDGNRIAVRLINPRKMSIEVRRNDRHSVSATTEVSFARLVMDRRRLTAGGISRDILVYRRAR